MLERNKTTEGSMYWARREGPSCTKGSWDCCHTVMVAGFFFGQPPSL